MSLNFVSNRASTGTGFFCNLSLKLPIETNVKLLCWKLLVVLLFYGPWSVEKKSILQIDVSMQQGFTVNLQ